VEFEEVKLRRIPAFQDILSLAFLFEKLSGRRQRARFGWINEPEQMRMVILTFDLTDKMLRYGGSS
jgi:hypothetical protein